VCHDVSAVTDGGSDLARAAMTQLVKKAGLMSEAQAVVERSIAAQHYDL
jgi:hypothetical protein